jgi:Na+/H+-dicarboxylate symporter
VPTELDRAVRSDNVKLLTHMKNRSFFRWMPTAIVLWIFGVVFTFAAGACLLYARQAARDSIQIAMIGDSQHTVRWFLRGAVADALVAVFCILGWYLMRKRLSATLALGGIAVMAAAFIICQRSLIYLFRGDGFMYWFDLVLELPFLLYAVIYAYRESRKVTV